MKTVFVVIDRGQSDADLVPVFVFRSYDEALANARLNNSRKSAKLFAVVEVPYFPPQRKAQKG